jgi:endonuclease/exonuclease/phosphatase family metal-dependent hydrolase
MEELAQLIKASNPDIVNLVEVENLAALSLLNDTFLAGYGYQPSFVAGTDTFTGQDVCILSRIDPEEFGRDDRSGTSGSTTKSVSKNYFAKFDIGGKNIALVGLHFLARPTDSSRRDARQAQAAVIKRKAHELASEGYSVIVLGDFNDYDGASDSSDHISSTPITYVLSTIREMDPFTDADDLVSVASALPKSSRFTALSDKDEDGQTDEPGELTSIDHVLVSPNLATCMTSVIINQGFNPHDVSDHFPITSQFDLSKLGDAPDPPPSPTGSTVVISRLLPNAAGNEAENEAVWLKNLGTTDVDLTGWLLRDLSNNTWTLTRVGSLSAGEEKMVLRANESMSLTNTGDTITLVDPDRNEVDTISYVAIGEGVEIVAGE